MYARLDGLRCGREPLRKGRPYFSVKLGLANDVDDLALLALDDHGNAVDIGVGVFAVGHVRQQHGVRNARSDDNLAVKVDWFERVAGYISCNLFVGAVAPIPPPRTATISAPTGSPTMAPATTIDAAPTAAPYGFGSSYVMVPTDTVSRLA